MPVCLWEREGAAGSALPSARTKYPGGVCWEQRCPHRALGLQVFLLLRNMEQSTVVSCITSQMAFAGFQEENLWAYFVLCQLPCSTAPHTERRWPLLDYTKEFIACRANRAFFVPVEQRMYQELGI